MPCKPRQCLLCSVTNKRLPYRKRASRGSPRRSLLSASPISPLASRHGGFLLPAHLSTPMLTTHPPTPQAAPCGEDHSAAPAHQEAPKRGRGRPAKSHDNRRVAEFIEATFIADPPAELSPYAGPPPWARPLESILTGVAWLQPLCLATTSRCGTGSSPAGWSLRRSARPPKCPPTEATSFRASL